MASPSPGSEVAVGSEQLEKAGGNTLVHIEVRAESGVEPLDGAAGSMAPLKQAVDFCQDGVRPVAGDLAKAVDAPDEQPFIVVAIPRPAVVLQVKITDPNYRT